LLEDMNPLRDQVMDSCAEFTGFIEQYIDNATAKAEIRTSHLMWIASTLVGMTAISGLALLWLFIRGVHTPLRRMALDAKTFSDVGHAGLSNPPDDEFKAVGFYLRALMADVTNTRSALHRSIQQTHNAEKLAAVGKLAASVAHEIRNPLIAVKLWLTSIQKKKSDDEELCRNLGMMSDEITRLDGLVRDFLEFSRPRALNIEPIQISALLDETLDLVGHRYEGGQINLVRKYSAEIPPIMGDWKQLKQIFINLMNNAAEAMPEGGEIRVLASYVHDIDARPMVLVRVQDTGSGIAENIQQRLFEPFFTTKECGTGLGLCIAAGIMTRHGGRLVLESSNERGTTFAVWIPAVDGKQDAIASTIREPMVKTHE
jgi:signal transduction histidine kinase